MKFNHLPNVKSWISWKQPEENLMHQTTMDVSVDGTYIAVMTRFYYDVTKGLLQTYRTDVRPNKLYRWTTPNPGPLVPRNCRRIVEFYGTLNWSVSFIEYFKSTSCLQAMTFIQQFWIFILLTFEAKKQSLLRYSPVSFSWFFLVDQKTSLDHWVTA